MTTVNVNKPERGLSRSTWELVSPRLLVRRMLQLKLQMIPWGGEFTRACGSCWCEECGFELFLHPCDPHQPDLVIVCTGERFKL